MIIYKCDLCRKKANKIDSIVLYKTKIDYCENCKTKANEIKRALTKSMKYFNDEFDRQITETEKNIIRRYK